jgi:hypothetical protein
MAHERAWKEGKFALNLCIWRILSPEFNLNVECGADEITKKVVLKFVRFEERAERAGKFCQNL